MTACLIQEARRPTGIRHYGCRIAAAIIATILIAPAESQIFRWAFDPTVNPSVRIDTQLWADDWVATPMGIGDSVINFRNFWTLGMYAMGFPTYGISQGAYFQEKAEEFAILPGPPPFPTRTTAEGIPHVLIYGVDTDTIEIVWLALAAVDTASLDGFEATAAARAQLSVHLYIANVQPTTPVTIHYQYDLRSMTHTTPERLLPIDDPASVRQANLYIDGVNLTADRFDLRDRNAYREYRSPVFVTNTTAGTRTRIEAVGFVDAAISRSGLGPDDHVDSAWAYWTGSIRLKVVQPGEDREPLYPEAFNGYMDFSLDIGSDTELSDPAADGDERFDPGDLYPFGGVTIPPHSTDGSPDDGTFWAGWSDPFPMGATPVPVAPICSGSPPAGLQTGYFDLDGHDALDFSLVGMIPADTPLAAPIERFGSSCICSARYLLVSYDDDDARHYADCDVPAAGTGPAGVTYGTTAGRDEVVGLTTHPDVPARVLRSYAIADEEMVHAGLTPNPDASEPDDDDVDSLDARLDASACSVLLFSADHEATWVRDPDPTARRTPLDPATIYEVGGGLPTPVVRGTVHLGLPPGTDIDAFEFVWLWRDGFTPPADVVLTLLFSVSADDPLTNADESGGLDPRMIYGSHLTGTSFEFLAAPLPDNVDALTAWLHELHDHRPLAGDLDLDNDVDIEDLARLLSNFGRISGAGPFDGDLDGDGDVELADLALMLASFGASAP